MEENGLFFNHSPRLVSYIESMESFLVIITTGGQIADPKVDNSGKEDLLKRKKVLQIYFHDLL